MMGGSMSHQKWEFIAAFWHKIGSDELALIYAVLAQNNNGLLWETPKATMEYESTRSHCRTAKPYAGRRIEPKTRFDACAIK
uniref:Uncharacterized protein n=1 Tax=Arundo donax TaxID=35708 RepID=A0A0A8ZB84_ARUDO